MYNELSNVKTDILDGSQGQYKTVIICNSAAEVDELVPFLESQCFHVLAAHEDMTLHHNVGKYTIFFIVGIPLFYTVQFTSVFCCQHNNGTNSGYVQQMLETNHTHVTISNTMDILHVTNRGEHEHHIKIPYIQPQKTEPIIK